MRSDIIVNGFTVLADSFPPSLNTAADPTTLAVHESPAVWGVSMQSDGLLQNGSLPIAQPSPVTEYLIGDTTFQWFYNRLWLAVGNVLYYGAPFYKDYFARQGDAEIPVDEPIVSFRPALTNNILIVTADGSYLLKMANAKQTEKSPERWARDFYTAKPNQLVIVNGMPWVSNERGVFSWDGQNVTEHTRPVRYSPVPFANSAIAADYSRAYIIGPTWAIDSQAKKLFDYSKPGFGFTSRTLSQADGMGPFSVFEMGWLVDHLDNGDGTISWATSLEDDDWIPQEDVECKYGQDKLSRIQTAINSEIKTAHKFRVKITAMSANIALRRIEVKVGNFALGTVSA